MELAAQILAVGLAIAAIFASLGWAGSRRPGPVGPIGATGETGPMGPKGEPGRDAVGEYLVSEIEPAGGGFTYLHDKS